MKSFLGLIVVCLGAVTLPPTALGDPPDLLRNYRFITRHSTLDVSGGFAGFDMDLPIHGSFGLVTGYRYTKDSIDAIPRLQRYAEFVDVQAEAINPTDFGPYSFDLDESLNLSGLEGAPGPLMLPLDNWLFGGVDGQGAKMSLHAIEVDRWLVMFGSNDTVCCDYFDYEITAIARQMPFADFDLDGDSDRDDFRRLVANFGLWDGGLWDGGLWDGGQSSEAMLEYGDSDGDGDVDGTDFLNLQRDQGETVESVLGFATSTVASSVRTVPEPASYMLALLGLTGIMLRRR